MAYFFRFCVCDELVSQQKRSYLHVDVYYKMTASVQRIFVDLLPAVLHRVPLLQRYIFLQLRGIWLVHTSILCAVCRFKRASQAHTVYAVREM